MSEVESVLVGHHACPACGSSDNLAVYLKETEDGDKYDGYCWGAGCNTFFHHNELIEQGVIDGSFVVDKTKLKELKKRITTEELDDLKARTSFDGTMANGKPYRGLKNEYLEFYRHRFERNSKGVIIAEYYPETDDEGVLNGFKSRVLPKNFGWKNIGKTGLSNQMSGQHLFKGGRDVVIVGGEIDKVTVYQLLSDYRKSKNQGGYDDVAVVSPTCGEGSAVQQCKAQYDWFDKFENVIVMLDNDEAGNKATKELVKVLPEGKVKVATLSGKDPNQMLQDGKGKAVVSAFFNAKPVVESELISSVDAVSGIKDFLLSPKITLPPQMEKLQDAMRGGIKSTGAIVNIIGLTSIGKSFFTDSLVEHFIFTSPLLPTIVSLERTAPELTLDMISGYVGRNFTYIADAQQAIEEFDKPEVQAKIDELVSDEFGKPRFLVVDDRSCTVDGVINLIEKTVRANNSKLIIIDPLTDLLRHLPTEEQEKFMQYQKNRKKDGIVFVNVLHTRKPQPNKDGTVPKVTEYDVLGTGAFVQSADINIVLNRNKMAEDEVDRNTTLVSMPKCRGGKTGDILELVFDPITRKQREKQDYLMNLHNAVLSGLDNTITPSYDGEVEEFED